MKLEHSFDVKAPLERVWQALIDVERVAPCLPGAEITEAGDDGSYRGNFTVKLGPTTASYRGELAMEEVDEQAHRAVMRASGSDKRGQGSAKATIVNVMRQEGELTKVEVVTDFTITGRLARFGRGGMIQDVSNRLLRDFSECLQETIESAEPGAGQAAAQPSAEQAPAENARTAPAPTQAARPAPRQTKPVGGLSLLMRVLVDRLKRLFGRG
jgi:carbon monoxide dehydrogenase subunit G